jgi:tRNA(fMet)-specific endonuclease VapC
VKFLPDTNACIAMLRQNRPRLTAKWQTVRPVDMVLCSIVVYELRFGADRAPNPANEHAKVDLLLSPYASLPFDDRCAVTCAKVRYVLERAGTPIGPYDVQIATIALTNGLTLVTHNTREFSRVSGLDLEDWEI